MKVRALRTHSYAGHNYKRGAEYDISKPKDLKVLIAVKAVEVISGPARPTYTQMVAMKKKEVAKSYTAREETDLNSKVEDAVDDGDVPSELSDETKKKRSRGNKYSRKDLRAEGE